MTQQANLPACFLVYERLCLMLNVEEGDCGYQFVAIDFAPTSELHPKCTGPEINAFSIRPFNPSILYSTFCLLEKHQGSLNAVSGYSSTQLYALGTNKGNLISVFRKSDLFERILCESFKYSKFNSNFLICWR